MFQKKYFLALLLIFQIVVLQFLKPFPEVVENLYCSVFFVALSQFLRKLLGSIFLSVGDVIYFLMLLYIAYSAYKSIGNWSKKGRNYLLKCVNFVSVLYFLFHFMWGLNYYRTPLFKKMNLNTAYSDADLFAFTEKLISKTNRLQIQITKNKNQKVVVPYRNVQMQLQTLNGYNKLAVKHTFFKYQILSIKPSLFSIPLSYMGFSGYLNPFTNEAQYNANVPRYGLPITICHEMAHQIGYANESECNFIGYLSANANSNLYFKYAANTLALKYCLRAVAMQNTEKSKYYLTKLNKGIVANLNEDKMYYLKYHSFIETGFEIFYDRFLKINQQQDGIESYSKFIDLLINYDKKNPN